MKLSLKLLLSVSFCSVLLLPAAAMADSDAGLPEDNDLYSLSLEDLGKVQLYSAAKRPEKLSESASAAFILTGEDIKRSGATSLVEALRLVPGVQVARIDAHTWAVSIRGFNRQFSNKLLVMIDGRSIYTPLFSGVLWDEHDHILEDIERIEVIRGPGGALWGANAVNGVINIITKEARKTQGNYASFKTGTHERNITEYRYGGHTSNTGFYRVYGKYRDSSSFRKASDHSDANDQHESARGGFRYDFRNRNFDSITISGDVFSGTNGLYYNLPHPTLATYVPTYDRATLSGANIKASWQRKHDNTSTTTLNTYVDYTNRNNYPLLEQLELITYDIDAQNTSSHGRHEFIFGGGARVISDNIGSTPYLGYAPESKVQNILSLFAQDKIRLNDKLFLTLGSKFEHNDYTGFEVQPNARISYLINPQHSVWAAISRAVRTPQRGEVTFSNFSSSAPLGTNVAVGNKDFRSEELIAYELGYRAELTRKLYIDTAAFYNDYDSLRTSEFIAPNTLMSKNNASGETYGVEVYGVYTASTNLDFKAGYSFLVQNVHLNEGSIDPLSQNDEGRSPKNQASFAVIYRPHSDVTFDNYVYYVDNLKSGRVPSYIRFDSRLAWQPSKDLEVSLTGYNLFDEYHPEFTENLFSVNSEIPRSVLFGISYKF